MSINPLYMPQRETAGSSTISKFVYQHHWSLLRALQYYKENTEFILCGEYHDDVLFILCEDEDKPLDDQNISIELNQIKAYKKPLSMNALVKTTVKKPNSFVGKMILGVNGKSFESKVKKLSLVSASGFSDLKIKEGLNLEVININDLIDENSKKIKDKLDLEFENIDIKYNKDSIEKINFINTTLNEDGMDSMLIGEITKILDYKFNENDYNIINIYRTLIDDIQKKCMETYDYKKWNDFKKNKGLTNFDLDRVRKVHTIKNKEGVSFEILDTLPMGNMKRLKIKKNLILHHNLLLDKAGNISENKIHEEIRVLLNNKINVLGDDISIEDIDILIKELPESTLQLFTNEYHGIAAMIYGIESFIGEI